ncbi:Gfo/Idh/MocA family protein [Actinomadura harenae]|uniref:Gfo/Idh/MocA family oxidoreductase n=1 Tax=Actinomadura harenae TaxID=2483351 RepID=A0A3M2LM81_9ACTN|nr:Gfo/Idh/MocA family oxidoreductase [Actinomadura harenae]RMI38564.1 gfo/Idh/MocA family oxidoreductase [Actinomadura harenae]
MKVAIAGLGTAGTSRLGSYAPLPGVEVVAVADPSPHRRAQAGVRAYAGLAELLAAESVDVVDVCTPPAYHRELSTLALRASCDVICEKPVAFTTADALALAETSRRTGRLLYPAHNYRFSPMMRLLEEAVAKVVGTPATATFRIERSTHAAGTASWRPDWRRDPEVAGGGILLDHGSHCVYMLTRLFGGRPDTVAATARFQDNGIEEAIDVRLEFPLGSAEIRLSWVGERRSNHYGLTGPTGTLDVTDDVAVLSGPDGTERRELESPAKGGAHEEWFAAMFADFTEVRAEPERWAGPLDEILSTAQIIEAAYASARRDGRPATFAGQG